MNASFFRYFAIAVACAVPALVACNAIVGVEDVTLRDQKSRSSNNDDDDDDGTGGDDLAGKRGEDDDAGAPPTCSGLCVTQIALGRAFGCALANDGKVRCWGDNAKGQTGAAGATTTKPAVVAGLTAVKEIAAGSDHACALVESGKVYCWGDNSNGIVTGTADTTATPRPKPTEVTGLPMPPAHIAGISGHQCALLPNGELYCWGYNGHGQCGVAAGTTKRVLRPTKALAAVKEVGGAEEVTCALLTDGKVSCFGRNLSGQLGRGDSDGEEHAVPAPVTGLPSKVGSIRPGTGFHIAVTLESNKVAAWGSNARGGVSGESPPTQYVSAKVLDAPANAVEVAPGGYFTCAVLDDGAVSCWGDNTSGQSGPRVDGGTGQPRPTRIAGIDHAAHVAAGREGFACAIAVGKVLCWGANEKAQLGRGAAGEPSDRPEPLAIDP